VTPKPLRLRPRARRDLSEIALHDRAEAGEAVALAFADALGRAFRHVALHPASASPRYARDLDLPGLRVWPAKRFPYLGFYFERDDHIDVVRVLHGKRDLAAWLAKDRRT
jgi:toxin ParE1/3/4